MSENHEHAGVEWRVALVKPGDLLLIGNVGPLVPGDAESAGEFFRALGIRVLMFAEDITLDVLPGGAA